MPKFTVVIPLFNKEKHIKRSICSVLRQSYKDFELIIVDDGSYDESLNIVNSMNNDKLIIIKQNNMGVSVARNTGIKNANGKFIAFLDADDEWNEDFLYEIHLLTNDFPNCGLYATAYKIFENNKEILPKYNGIEKTEFRGIIEDFFYCNMMYPLVTSSSVVIPKYAFDELGMFKVGITNGEDIEMWARVAMNYDVAFSGVYSAIYYKNSENRVSDLDKNLELINIKNINGNLEIIKTINHYKEYYNLTSQFIDEYITLESIGIAERYINIKQPNKARKLLELYNSTKIFKKQWLKCYLKTFVPYKLISLKRRISTLR